MNHPDATVFLKSTCHEHIKIHTSFDSDIGQFQFCLQNGVIENVRHITSPSPSVSLMMSSCSILRGGEGRNKFAAVFSSILLLFVCVSFWGLYYRGAEELVLHKAHCEGNEAVQCYQYGNPFTLATDMQHTKSSLCTRTPEWDMAFINQTQNVFLFTIGFELALNLCL